MEFHEEQDILGQSTLPIVHQDTGASKFTVTKSIFAFAFLFALYVVGMRIRREVLIWRERAYKLETRRRHGIPDSDRRPFNIAYAAAQRDKEAREKDSKRARRSLSRPVQATSAGEGHADQSLTNRSDRLRSTTIALPGAFIPNYVAGPPANLRALVPEPPLPSPTRSAFNETASHRRSNAGSQPNRTTRRHAAQLPVDLASNVDATKRGSEAGDWDDSDPSRMSRIDGDESMDADDEALWQPKSSSAKGAGKRPYERGEDDDESEEDEGVREKRQRKVSLDQSGTVVGLGDMDVDEGDEYDDEVPEIIGPVVGSKRGRADAASTFGDDDDHYLSDDNKSTTRRHRKKRQTGSKKHTAVDSKKRGREDDETAPSESGTISRRTKKNRQGLHQDAEVWSISSSGRRQRKRRIGEEWEVGSIRYKIGPNGQRLRQALIKKARSKFNMPKDSNHPDRDANLEVYVETWLTEEEYKDARDDLLLAWQDPPKRADEPDENLSIDVPTSRSTPSRPGKNLLWQSTNGTPSGSPIPGSPLDSPSDLGAVRPKGVRNSGRYSLGAGALTNPFEKLPVVSARRIASTSLANSMTASTNSLSDKTNEGDATNGYVRPRNLSKWEKQEVEAQAIARLRALKRAESDAKEKEAKEQADKEKAERERVEKERQEREKAEKERQEKEKKEKEAAAPKIPTITVTQPTLESIKPANSGFSFGPTPSTSSATPAASTTATSAPSTTNPLFGGGASSTPSSTATQPEVPKSNNLFSFKPSTTAVAPYSSTAPASSNLFSFGPSTSTTSATNPSPFGVPAATAAKPDEQKDQSAQPAGGSLFSRLGPQVGGADTSRPAETPAAAPPASSGFSFAKPATGGTTPGGLLFNGQSATTAAPASTPAAAPASGAAPAKFSFGFGPLKPTESTPSAALAPAAPASSSLAGALGGGQPAGSSAGTKFSFGTPAAATDASKPSTTPAAPAPSATTAPSNPSAPKFGFGTGTGTGNTGSVFGSGSAFGTSNPPAAPATSTSSSTAAAPASGSVFGATSTPSVFGATSTPSAFPFANGSTSQDKGKEAPKPANTFGGFGTGGSVFGGTGGANSGASSVFANAGGGIFGNTSKPAAAATSGTTATNGTSNEQPKFSFGTAPASAAATSSASPAATTTPKAPSPFAFTSGVSTTPAGNPPASSGTASSNLFSFKPPTGASSTAPTGSVFGSTSTPGTASSGTTGSAFGGFGAGSAASTTPAAKSVFGVTSTPTTGTTGTTGSSVFGQPPQPLSAFGFSTPTTSGTGTTGTNGDAAVGTTTPAGTPAFSFGKTS